MRTHIGVLMIVLLVLPTYVLLQLSPVSTVSTELKNVNVIVLLSANDSTFDAIFRYVDWLVHDQKLLPDNYHFKWGLHPRNIFQFHCSNTDFTQK
jgi:hypothetical protein